MNAFAIIACGVVSALAVAASPAYARPPIVIFGPVYDVRIEPAEFFPDARSGRTNVPRNVKPPGFPYILNCTWAEQEECATRLNTTRECVYCHHREITFEMGGAVHTTPRRELTCTPRAGCEVQGN